MAEKADDILTSFVLSEDDRKKYDIVRDKFNQYFMKKRNVIFYIAWLITVHMAIYTRNDSPPISCGFTGRFFSFFFNPALMALPSTHMSLQK